ncbi:MAG: hypothetical protein JOY95_07025 [Silvibacterium sp.]|nr:hypothetical protein [Silvibacterium sp.]
MSSISQEQERKQLDNLARHAGQLLPLLKDPVTLDVNADGSLWLTSWGLASSVPAIFLRVP